MTNKLQQYIEDQRMKKRGYMRIWREKNRLKLRKYNREYMRIYRMNKVIHTP